MKGLPLIIYGDGSQTRDFVYVEDVVDAILLALSSDGSGIYNVGVGAPVSVNELARLILELTASSSEIIYAPPRLGDISRSYADISSIIRDLNFHPEVSLRCGLKRSLVELKAEGGSSIPL